tara:strand:+ start:18258 stop:18851 length:594 start_codon:yes stop_codon:yes gene_type:complete
MNLYQELKKIKSIVKTTQTMEFMMPLTGYSKEDLSPYIINAYLGDVSFIDKLGTSPDIYILLRFSKHISFYTLEKQMKDNKCFKKSYPLLRGTYIMYVYTLNKKFISDFDSFLVGKYSTFSNLAKTMILKDRSSDSPMKSVLEKSESLRDYWENRLDEMLPENSEVWSAIDYNQELFALQEFKEVIGYVDLPASLMR